MKNVLFSLVASLTLLGCKKEPPPPVSTVPRPMPMQGTQGQAPATPMQGMPEGVVPPPPMPTAQETLQWDLPAGWSEARAQGMRVATFKPKVEGKVDISVIRLPGEAGGELANVNRWRGQINLPPIDEATRAASRKEITAKAGTISLYEFAGEGAAKQRMLAGLFFVGGHSWFVKMVGDDTPVAESRADFEKLLASLRFPAGK